MTRKELYNAMLTGYAAGALRAATSHRDAVAATLEDAPDEDARRNAGVLAGIIYRRSVRDLLSPPSEEELGRLDADAAEVVPFTPESWQLARRMLEHWGELDDQVRVWD